MISREPFTLVHLSDHGSHYSNWLKLTIPGLQRRGLLNDGCGAVRKKLKKPALCVSCSSHSHKNFAHEDCCNVIPCLESWDTLIAYLTSCYGGQPSQLQGSGSISALPTANVPHFNLGRALLLLFCTQLLQPLIPIHFQFTEGL